MRVSRAAGRSRECRRARKGRRPARSARSPPASTADMPSARSAMPSGGERPRDRVDDRPSRAPHLDEDRQRERERERRGAERDPLGTSGRRGRKRRECPPTGSRIARTSSAPPGVVASAEAVMRLGSVARPVVPASGSSVTLTGLLGEAEHQRDRERARRESHHDAGDHHRLRHGIEGKAADRAAPRDDAEHEEHAAADQIESEQLPQRLRIDDQRVEAEPDEPGADEAGDDSTGSSSALPARRPRDQQRQRDRDRQHHEGLDEQDDRFGEPRGKAKKLPAMNGPASPATRNTAGPAISASRRRREPIRGGSVRRAIITIIHMAARIAPPWKAPPGSSAPTQNIWTPITMPIGASTRARKTSAASGRRGAEGRGPAAPEPVRRDRPDADDRKHQHHLLEHGVERRDRRSAPP